MIILQALISGTFLNLPLLILNYLPHNLNYPMIFFSLQGLTQIDYTMTIGNQTQEEYHLY